MGFDPGRASCTFRGDYVECNIAEAGYNRHFRVVVAGQVVRCVVVFVVGVSRRPVVARVVGRDPLGKLVKTLVPPVGRMTPRSGVADGRVGFTPVGNCRLGCAMPIVRFPARHDAARNPRSTHRDRRDERKANSGATPKLRARATLPTDDHQPRAVGSASMNSGHQRPLIQSRRSTRPCLALPVCREALSHGLHRPVDESTSA